MGKRDPFQMQQLPLHSQKVKPWCEFTAAFIVGPFFFEENSPSGPVTYTDNGTRYESLLRNQLCNSVDVWIAQFLCKWHSFAHCNTSEAAVESGFWK
ncbi:hypothetical protein AVEN_151023-1 [Araneus ventricosus]|uniref:Uncharacterized protein n=1 Tax=Araneus ventricosus TaxID=182803 RepID=A0A4Y2IA16_ARAVE|nr:hypothetical protein AVEN_151023-1 [Araneus ventricosus]